MNTVPAYTTMFPIEIADATNLTPQDSIFLETEQEISRLFPARSIQRVLLVLPPTFSVDLFRFEDKRKPNYHNSPPYGLGILATQLRRAGIAVRILNINNTVSRAALQMEDKASFDYERIVTDSLEQEIATFKPDLIGLSALFSMAHKSCVDCCRWIRKITPETPIALGGVHFTNSFTSPMTRDKLLADLEWADFIFTHEAELAFNAFIHVVNKKSPLSSLAQVAFIRTSPVIHFANRITPSAEDLDLIPAFDLFSLDELSINGKVGALDFLVPSGTRIACSLSSRGCRAQCTFCSVRQFNGPGVRVRSVESVIEELLVLKNEYGVQHIAWLDDDFLYDSRRAVRLFNEMVRKNIGLTWDWSNGVIAASCTDEIIGAAEASGCIGMYIGMESGSPQILKSIKKPGKVRHFLRAAEVLRKHDQINARVYLMLGFPSETFGMLRETFDVASEMGLDWNNVQHVQPLPNTPLSKDVMGYRKFSELMYQPLDHPERTRAALNMGDILLVDFERIFDENDSQSIPNRDQLYAIWAHMFFYLNYQPLFTETRRLKLLQAFYFIDRMAHFVVPGSGFAWYFRNYLAHRLGDKVDAEAMGKLKQIMDQHELYRIRFQQLQMPLEWMDEESTGSPISQLCQ